ncbi:L,D-transpeptidase [Lacticaseibacillus daqingensis]|uniref:L,D-transpeptidase n=1 Tax=Lacticaseibacillus daqingensis TaxID=2486014 RepID=UPI000F7855BE|nr:L,D-transpeptidase [Lacticaseibacillus daqingensis]
MTVGQKCRATLAATATYLTTHHLKRWVKQTLWGLGALAVLLVGAALLWRLQTQPQAAAKAPHASRAATSHPRTTASSSQASSQKAVAVSSAPVIDWQAPSENKPYPTVADHPHLSIVVSLADQRVYFKDGATVLYTMYASSGINNTTPRGQFAIQRERGDYFYNPREQMGAHYYTSFLDHGTYLFHSVPTDPSGHYIAAEAAKLGKEPGSHGCVRLSIPDAKWLNENVPTGVPVTIR